MQLTGTIQQHQYLTITNFSLKGSCAAEMCLMSKRHSVCMSIPCMVLYGGHLSLIAYALNSVSLCVQKFCRKEEVCLGAATRELQNDWQMTNSTKTPTFNISCVEILGSGKCRVVADLPNVILAVHWCNVPRCDSTVYWIIKLYLINY